MNEDSVAPTAHPTAGHAAKPVAGGPALARQGNRPRIEQEIRARYAAELAAADICDSLRLEAQIRAEIERALALHSEQP
jgi:hypothetical protein